MLEILQILVDPFGFLWGRGYDFTITRSARSASFGNASIEAASNRLLLKFIRDRGQIFLDIASPSYPEEWLSVDLFERILDVDFKPSALADDRSADFLRRHYANIASGLVGDSREGTLRQLKNAKRQRGKEMFG